jgi:hypothetical protein
VAQIALSVDREWYADQVITVAFMGVADTRIARENGRSRNMQSFDFQQYFTDPTDVGLISASKKFAEVLRAVHGEWSNQEPDFDLDLTGFDYYAKDLFLNEFFIFFSSVHGGVKNRKSVILDPELRKPILKEATKNLQVFQDCLGDIDTSQTIESQMYALREVFRDRLIGNYFTQESREMFHGLRPEVEQLDSWVALIFSEVVVSSHFGKGSPTADPIDAAFYLYVKSKEEHVAASLLIGSGLVNEWLVESPIRGIIGRNELDDDEAYERESLRRNDQI